MEEKKPHTHVAWVQRREAGRFQEWLEVGHGRPAENADGQAGDGFEGFLNRMPIGGWSGYVQFLPVGVKPKDPEEKPRRPSMPTTDEN